MGKKITYRERPGKGGRRKIGRNTAKCEAYRSRGQRERNRDRRARRILKGFRSAIDDDGGSSRDRT